MIENVSSQLPLPAAMPLSFCYGLCLELYAKINPLCLQLPKVMAFYHSSRRAMDAMTRWLLDSMQWLLAEVS